MQDIQHQNAQDELRPQTARLGSARGARGARPVAFGKTYTKGFVRPGSARTKMQPESLNK